MYTYWIILIFTFISTIRGKKRSWKLETEELRCTSPYHYMHWTVCMYVFIACYFETVIVNANCKCWCYMNHNIDATVILNLMNITNNLDNKKSSSFVFNTIKEPVSSAVRVYPLHSITLKIHFSTPVPSLKAVWTHLWQLLTQQKDHEVTKITRKFMKFLTLPNSCFFIHQTLSSSNTYYNKNADYPVPKLCNNTSWHHLYAVSSHLDRVNIWVETPIFYTLSNWKVANIMISSYYHPLKFRALLLTTMTSIQITDPTSCRDISLHHSTKSQPPMTNIKPTRADHPTQPPRPGENHHLTSTISPEKH